MKTRFDYTNKWIAGDGRVLPIDGMTTGHLINLYAMFSRYPERTMLMIVADIENDSFCGNVWDVDNTYDTVASIGNVTKLTSAELTAYALNSPLGRAIRQELISRGVMIDNAMSVMQKTV